MWKFLHVLKKAQSLREKIKLSRLFFLAFLFLPNRFSGFLTLLFDGVAKCPGSVEYRGVL